MLYVSGTLQLRGVLKFDSFPAELTQSGSTAVEITSFRRDVTQMVATGATATQGANGKYATARWQNPKTQTASLLSFCLDIYTAPSPSTTTSCWINNESTTGSGSARYLFRGKPLVAGHLCFVPTGHSQSGTYLPVIGVDEHIKCSNSLGAGSGQGLVGDLDIIYRTSRL